MLWQGRGIAIEQVAFQHALMLSPDEPRISQVLFTPESWGYLAELFSRPSCIDGPQPPAWVRHTSGKVSSVESVPPTVAVDKLQSRLIEEVEIEEVYGRIGRQGLRYGPSFRLLRRAWRGPGEALGEVVLPEDSAIDTDGYCFHPALLDACLHVIAAMHEADRPGPLLPVGLQRFEALGRPGPCLWTHATLRAAEAGTAAGFTSDVEVIDPDGRRIARFEGLQFREVPPPSGLATGPAANVAASPRRRAPWLARLEEVPPGNRARLLVALLRAEVAAVLGWESADRVSLKQSLLELGMDSLGAVELQSRLQKALGCDLPVTLAIDHPNVQSLAGYLVRRLGLGVEAGAGQDDREESPDDGRRLAEMSDEEVETLLKERYRHLL
jgi:acyl carrier protein